MAQQNIAESIRSSADQVKRKPGRPKKAEAMDMDDGPTVVNMLVQDIKNKLQESERARFTREAQWIRNLNSYRGNDTSGEEFRGSEQSKVYVRTTTVKVKAAYAQIIEALFSEPKFPIGITDTRVPEGVSEFAHLKTDMEANVTASEDNTPAASLAPAGGIGFEGDNFELAPGSTQDKMKFLGGLTNEFTNEQGESVLAEGTSKDGGPQLSPSAELARRMEKIIHDRLEETNARTEVRKMVFEMCLLGTGVMKGPFNMDKTLHKWDDNGVYSPETVRTNRSSMVSVWDFHPDPNASSGDDMEWAIEDHTMHSGQIRALKDRPHFNAKAIDRLLMRSGNFERRTFDDNIDEAIHTESDHRLYRVLEFWGFMDKKKLEEFDIDTSGVGESAQVNVWTSGNEILRVVVNPFIPQRIPYYVVPYETDPYTIWGTGVPESMEDTQALQNGFMRMAVDNLALAGNLIFEIDDSMLVPGQEMDVYPGKIFRGQNGGQGQAIRGIQFPNTAPALMDMFRQVRQMSDESTGIPSFAHGQMGVMSPTRTASGMSMLLNNASLNIKTVIRNIDDFLLTPWGQAYYRWEMQFNEDVTIKGDLEIRAMGSSSMQAKEVRSNRLNTFLQLAANPALAPLIKFSTVIRELAISMDMDPEEILNSPEEQQIFAQLMGTQGMQQPQQGGPQPTAPGTSMPGEQGFTGNAEGAGNSLGLGGGMEGGSPDATAAASF